MSTEKVVDPKILELAKKLQAKKDKQAEKRKKDLAAKYPHALLDTLQFDAVASKMACKIKCVECGDTQRTVYTSDLWQVKACTKCTKARQAKARKAKQAKLKEAMEFLANK